MTRQQHGVTESFGPLELDFNVKVRDHSVILVLAGIRLGRCAIGRPFDVNVTVHTSRAGERLDFCVRMLCRHRLVFGYEGSIR